MADNYRTIPAEKFTFVQKDALLKDKKLETKARSYLADAWIRFRKNKSSVVAAVILLLLVLYAIIVPIVSPYTMEDKDPDKRYVSFPPFVKSVADQNKGYLDGAVQIASINEVGYQRLLAIGEETGMNPIIQITGTTETEEMYRGKPRKVYFYSLEANQYYLTGIVLRVLSYEEFEDIQRWQDETGTQVIYPWVETKDIKDIDDPAIWYKVSDNKGTAKLDKEGNRVPVYSTKKSIEGAPYNSIRVPSDDGSYIYSVQKSGAVQVRMCYFNYTIYKTGHLPDHIFGVNSKCEDLATAIAVGARFSLIFAIAVSVINLTIGAVYGAIQGYYGGYVDLFMDRISDILSGLPFTVCVVLFQYHLGGTKFGTVGAFLLAFVVPGWIGMAALTRKQFYRFKSREYIMAARTLGASDKRLIFKHIFPNAIGTIITSCALVIPGIIRSETSMTYLGIVNVSQTFGASLGDLLSTGQTYSQKYPYALFFPSIYFALLLICFNLFGNGLRDAFNPSNRGVED